MAGQPQEPWQSYSPPPEDKHDTYAYQQPGAQGYGQAQAAPRPPQGFPPEQPYTTEETSPGQGGHDPRVSYQGPQGQEAHWQAPAVPASRAGSEAKGFLGALFDFGFTAFVTPKVIKALYVLYTIWMVVWALIFLRLGFKYGGAAGGIFTLILVDPIFLLLTLGAYRVILEFFMVIHRIHDDLRAIRERTDERG